jgi:hypothetical protein
MISEDDLDFARRYKRKEIGEMNDEKENLKGNLIDKQGVVLGTHYIARSAPG